ncbi:MAG: GNAT family N-acetyltransferase [Lachnospiraceae bacterium]|nr:GNAT family N-acetyltransferase [Lachnospiraceae bacterium]
MKIVDAVWEERNLGKRCKEIYIQKSDARDDVLKKISEMDEEFLELFLPIECPEYLLYLPQQGFYYIESNLDLVKKCQADEIFPKTYDKILQKVHSRQLESDEIENFLYKLRTEYFFEKDKISIDYHFSQEASANRNYWRLKDYYAEGRDIRIYEVWFQQRAIGYFILNVMEQGHIDVYLSGLYPECRSKSLGTCIMGEETRQAECLGAKLITTGVSLNNFACLRIYLSLGYEIKKGTNIFVKHKRDDNVSKR